MTCVTIEPGNTRIDHAYLRELATYINETAAALGLADWHFTIEAEPAKEGTYAQVNPVMGQRRAWLRFAVEVFDQSAERLREVIVHELMHCHVDRMDTAFHAAVDAGLGPQAEAVAVANWESVLEDAVDNIATAIAMFLPVPPLTASKAAGSTDGAS